MNRLYEPWFRAWLILAPIIGLSSYYLMRNSWRRIRDIMQGNAGSVWDAPPFPMSPSRHPLYFTPLPPPCSLRYSGQA